MTAELQRASITSSDLFGSDSASNDPLRRLFVQSVTSVAAVDNFERRLNRFAAILSKNAGHHMQMTFHLLEKEIQDALARSSSQSESNQLSAVQQRKSTVEQQIINELSPIKQLDQDAAHKQSELLKRRAELERELAAVNSDLSRVESQRTQFKQQMDAIASRHQRSLTDLNNTMNSLQTANSQRDRERSAYDALHGFVVSSYDSMSKIIVPNVAKLTAVCVQCSLWYSLSIFSLFLDWIDFADFTHRHFSISHCNRQLHHQSAAALQLFGSATTILHTAAQPDRRGAQAEALFVVAIR